MELMFSIEPEKLKNESKNQYDIYDYMKIGLGPELNSSPYGNKDILVTNYDKDDPFVPNMDPGTLFYSIRFNEHKSNIFIEYLPDDVSIGFELTNQQEKLVDNFLNDETNERVSVKDLENADFQKQEIRFLYGFAVREIIKPEQILSWCVYMVLNNSSAKKIYEEIL